MAKSRAEKYYKEENKRHPKAHKTVLDLPAVHSLVLKLHKRYLLPDPEVVFEIGTTSYCDARCSFYSFALSDCTLLTVLHEVAHTLAYFEKITIGSRCKKHHCPVHKKWVDILVAEVECNERSTKKKS